MESASRPEVRRGRPGRRPVAERSEAVLALLSGKASVDQLATKYVVLPSTVGGWREAALKAISTALLQGDGRTEKERRLETEVSDLKEALGRVSVGIRWTSPPVPRT